MSNFIPAFRNHLESLPALGFWERRALRMTQEPEKLHNARVLARLERNSQKELMEMGEKGFESGIVDWFKANWKTVLQVVLSILSLLMMFAGPAEREGFEGEEGMTAWFPGKNILVSVIAPQFIDQVGLPWSREIVAELEQAATPIVPIRVEYTDVDLRSFMLRTLEKVK